MNDIIQAVSTLGFPITMCGALFWYMVKQNDLHREESKEMKNAITDLRLAITELTIKLKGDAENVTESHK